MTREEISEMIYNVPSLDDFWIVSIVYKDAFNNIENNYAYFHSRYDAEKWFSEFVRDKKCYYGHCCGERYWKNAEQLYEE